MPCSGARLTGHRSTLRFVEGSQKFGSEHTSVYSEEQTSKLHRGQTNFFPQEGVCMCVFPFQSVAIHIENFFPISFPISVSPTLSVAFLSKSRSVAVLSCSREYSLASRTEHSPLCHGLPFLLLKKAPCSSRLPLSPPQGTVRPRSPACTVVLGHHEEQALGRCTLNEGHHRSRVICQVNANLL